MTKRKVLWLSLSLLVTQLVFAASSLTVPANPSTPVSTGGGAPAAGFQAQSGYSTTGCDIQMAGGNMGNSATGANFVMDCAQQDGSGNSFMVINRDNSQQPKLTAGVSREGTLDSQGSRIFQGNYGGYPNGYMLDFVYVKTDGTKESTSARTWATGLSVQTDVPSTTSPIFSVWGLGNWAYAGAHPPIYQHYGSTFADAAQYRAPYGSKNSGTMLESLEDNGNRFTNQLPRTTAAYTNATTTLGVVTTASGGTLMVPVTSGRTYHFVAKLQVTTATGGVKVGINSSSTAAAINYQITCVNNATSAIIVAAQVTSLGSSAGSSTSMTSGGLCTLEGTITMSGGDSYTVNGTSTSGSAVLASVSPTADVNVGSMVVQNGVSCDVIPFNTYVVSKVADTSVTMSRNAACTSGSWTQASIAYTYIDTLWVEAASNAAGTLTLARGSTLQLTGSINGGGY